MEITINQKAKIQNAPDAFLEVIKTRLTFDNPKFLENQKMDRWNGETPRLLEYYESGDAGTLEVPRGFISHLIKMCKDWGLTYQLEDNRRTLRKVPFTFQGTLRPFQETAVKDVLSEDFGTLNAPTGSGKTIMALYLIAKRKQPCLVICHTKELARQWIDRANQFLGLPKDEIGLIGAGEMRTGKYLTVGIVNSIYKVADEVSEHIGFLICDECHRCPSRTFTEAVSAFDSKYMLGLSATPYRRDGLSRLIYYHLGDVVYKIHAEDLIETGDILQAEVVYRETNFDTCFNASEEYSKMLSELTQDPQRNAQIVRDVVREANNGGGVCLVLSDRKMHCGTLQGLLKGHGIRAELLTGDIPGKEREEIVGRLDAGLVKILIATGQLIGEGFDCKGLSTLFLTTPIRFDGRVLQYLGRVLRPAPGKGKAKVYDYVDSRVGVLEASAKGRQHIYDGGG